jgi:hypothetical protein
MRDDSHPSARLAALRRLSSLVTDPAAAEAIRHNIAALEAMPPDRPAAAPMAEALPSET